MLTIAAGAAESPTDVEHPLSGTLRTCIGDWPDCRRATGHVDLALKGEKPAELPVQTPVKYVLSIDLKTAERSASRCRPRCSRAPTR